MFGQDYIKNTPPFLRILSLFPFPKDIKETYKNLFTVVKRLNLDLRLPIFGGRSHKGDVEKSDRREVYMLKDGE